MRRSTLVTLVMAFVMVGSVVAGGGLGVAAADDVGEEGDDLEEADTGDEEVNETEDGMTDGSFGELVASFVSDLQDNLTDDNESLDEPFGHVVADYVLENNSGNAPDHAGPPDAEDEEDEESEDDEEDEEDEESEDDEEDEEDEESEDDEEDEEDEESEDDEEDEEDE
ncbi:MAG: hypothetical protein V5A25_13400, partial [Halovenus sp.]